MQSTLSARRFFHSRQQRAKGAKPYAHTCLFPFAGLAEDPHESDNGNYGDEDDGNQASFVQSPECSAGSMNRGT